MMGRMVRVTCHASRVTLFALGASLCGVAAAKAAPRDDQQLVLQLTAALASCREVAKRTVGYDVVFRRDPMRALVDEQGRLLTSAGLHGGLSVDGVIWSKERPLAVVDDELFAQGATLGPYTVLQIRQDGIVVKRKTDILLIPLDRGLQTPQERRVDPLSLLSLPEDVPVPYAPSRATVALPVGSDPVSEVPQQSH